MPDHLPKFKPGAAVTFRTTTAIIGGRVVEVTGDRKVGTAAAASAKAIGTAGHDAAQDTDVVVHLSGPVETFVSSAAIAAGVNVEAAADGKARTATTGRVLGITLTATTGADQTVQVLRG